MSEEVFGLDEDQLERISAMLNAYVAGRLNFAAQPRPQALGSPLPTQQALVTAYVSRGEHGEAGSGTARLLSMDPDTEEVGEQTGDDVTVYNLGGALAAGMRVGLTRESVSGRYFVEPPQCAFIYGPSGKQLNGWYSGTSKFWNDSLNLLQADSAFPVRCRPDDDSITLDSATTYLGIRVQDSSGDPGFADGTPSYVLFSHLEASLLLNGIVTTGTQTFGGLKSFWNQVTLFDSVLYLRTHGDSPPYSYIHWVGEIDINACEASGGHNYSTNLAIGGGKATLTYHDDTAAAYVQSSYAVVNATGGVQTGAWATVSGMTFCGGLYVSGSVTAGSITVGTTTVSGGTVGALLGVVAGPVLGQFTGLRGGTW